MSKIALEGNASGTGTFTIAGPNTNTNYTITLPQETGTLVTTGVTTGLNGSAITTGVVAASVGGTGLTSAGTNGNVLTSNGSAWVSQAAAAGGGDYIMQAYTSPATWTKPAGLKAVRVTVIGGGGSAGNFSTPAFPADQKTGGGGGGTGIKYLDAPAIPGPVTVTVGSGGAASGPQVGNAGGTSSFGPLVSATGGGGGNNGGANRYIAGGTATNATVSVSGGVGAATAYNACGAVTGFIGGGTVLAQPSYGYQINTGLAANNYGGGGGSWTGPTGIGVAGAGGIVIVEEFY
jgi:hypothetical protein